MRISDWSSEVCSSDLSKATPSPTAPLTAPVKVMTQSSRSAACISVHPTFLCWWVDESVRSQSVNRTPIQTRLRTVTYQTVQDRKSVVSVKRVSVRVDLGVPLISNTNKREKMCQ